MYNPLELRFPTRPDLDYCFQDGYHDIRPMTASDWDLIQCALNWEGWTYTRLGSMCAKYWHPQLRHRLCRIELGYEQSNIFFTSEMCFRNFLKNQHTHPYYYLEKDNV